MKSLHDIRGAYRAARRRYGRAYNKHVKHAYNKQEQFNSRVPFAVRWNRNIELARLAEQAALQYNEREEKLCAAIGIDYRLRNVYPPGDWHALLMGYVTREELRRKYKACSFGRR